MECLFAFFVQLSNIIQHFIGANFFRVLPPSAGSRLRLAAARLRSTPARGYVDFGKNYAKNLKRCISMFELLSQKWLICCGSRSL